MQLAKRNVNQIRESANTVNLFYNQSHLQQLQIENFRFTALHIKETDLRYMDESSAVLPSPDAGDYGDDSSGISATDFHVPSSPTKARPGTNAIILLLP